MLSTPSLLLTIDQVVIAIVASHIDAGASGREGEGGVACHGRYEPIYRCVLDCQAGDPQVAMKCQDIWIPILVRR